MIAFAVLVVVGGFLFTRLPGSFLPEEDQGYVIGIVQLPPGASLSRTMGVMSQMSNVIKTNEAVEGIFQVGGFGFFGQGENTGIMFVRLKPWEDRDISSDEFNQWANGALFATIKDATVFVVNLPTISGLGQFGGFDFFLEDHAGQGHEALMAAQHTLLAQAAQNPTVTNVTSSTLGDAPRLGMSVDRVQAQSMGLRMTDVYSAVQMMLAPVYANDFYDQGRVLRVLLQADAPYRMGPDALDRIYIPSNEAANGMLTADPRAAGDTHMIPLASVVRSTWGAGPTSVTRYNGLPAVEITGSPAPGSSSGEAMREMERIVREELPEGYGFDWAGQSLQEILAGAQAPLLFVLSIMVVYLCLAALYESWATPVAVMLVVPLGVLGAILAMWLRGMPNDVFFKIGLITIIGLAAKNAILIVEFAVSERESGKSVRESVLEAARLRLRPILMTSFAFILGVLPLVVSTGAGANARRAIGTGVVGGMLSAAILGVLLVPVFYVAVRRILRDPLDSPTAGGALPLPAKSEPR
jgi:multidrug efflux pump